MSTNPTAEKKYDFTLLQTFRGGRLVMKIKKGVGPNGAFVALEIGGRMDEREVVQIVRQQTAGGAVYCNFINYNLTELAGDLEAMRKAFAYAQAVEEKLTQASLATL